MKCLWVAKDEPRVLAAQHDDECADDECAGCEPCRRPHCLVQWHGDKGDCQTHAETVCPACVGKVREHLAEIVRMSGLPLVAQILATGDVDTEAADLLGPTALPAQWRQRGRHGHIYHPDSRIGELHPMWVLGTWDLLVTEHLGHTRTARITIATAADYLGRNLTWLAADLEFDFAVLAEELAACRRHLERVLHDGEQVETGAPCMTCRVPLRLVRETGEDKWRCPRCRQESTDAQYRYAVMHVYREHADWLTAGEVEIICNVKPGTLRKRVERGEVRSKRDQGRTVYCAEEIPEVVAQRRADSA